MPPRPAMPEGVKRAALIRAMGYGLNCAETGEYISPEDAIAGRIHFDHRPPLALRYFNEEAGKYEPDANDILFIDVVSAEGHAIRTNKKRGLNRGDQTEIARSRKVRAAEAKHQARMGAKAAGELKPIGQIKSRGFDKTFRKPMRGPTVRRHT